MDFLKRTARISRKDRIQNMRKREIMQRNKNVLEIIKQKRLSWYGHLKRMSENRIRRRYWIGRREGGKEKADRVNAGCMEYTGARRERNYVEKILWIGISCVSRLFCVEGEPLYRPSGIISAANTRTATTPEDVSHSRGRKVEGKESWEWKTPGLRKKTTTSTIRIPTHR